MTTTTAAIAAELNISADSIKNIKTWDGFLTFVVNGREYWNRLTKTGKHKKGSVRLACA